MNKNRYPYQEEKDRAREGLWQQTAPTPRPIPQWEGNNPRSGFLSSEQQLRVVQASVRINPMGVAAHSLPPNVVSQPSTPVVNPAYVEADAARNGRAWYPKGYSPYVGFDRPRKLSSGVQV